MTTVETYEVEEMKSSDATTMAVDAEALEIVERLGLAGQKKLANTETGTRLPYRKLTALEHVVFELHCPIKTELSQYASGPIPLRVLQVAALCKEERFFPRIEVWHPKDAKLDPVLIGRSMEESWRGDLFLLARWGEVWKDFATLVKEAREIWIAQQRAKFAKMRAEMNADEASVEAVAGEMFADGTAKTACYSGF